MTTCSAVASIYSSISIFENFYALIPKVHIYILETITYYMNRRCKTNIDYPILVHE